MFSVKAEERYFLIKFTKRKHDVYVSGLRALPRFYGHESDAAEGHLKLKWYEQCFFLIKSTYQVLSTGRWKIRRETLKKERKFQVNTKV